MNFLTSRSGPFRKGSAADRGRLMRFPALRAARPGFWRGLRQLGPGVVTGAADLDPSAVVTATVAGAAFQYSVVWVVLLCVPFLLTIFAVASRIGLESGQGLLAIVRGHYGKVWAWLGAGFTIVTNLVVIIADLMAVSESFSILLRQPRHFFVAVTAFSVWYVLIFHDYRKITRALVLVSLPLYLYLVAAFIAMPGPRQLLTSIVLPRVHLTADYVEVVVALFGSFLGITIRLFLERRRFRRGVASG